MSLVTIAQITQIYEQPLLELISRARQIHQQHFVDDIELCQLISVKTGGCPEDCGYCSQSTSNQSGIKVNPLMAVTEVEKIVIDAKAQGVKRICMGAGYKSPNSSALKRVTEYVAIIKKHGLEACATLGSLSAEQAQQLKIRVNASRFFNQCHSMLRASPIFKHFSAHRHFCSILL